MSVMYGARGFDDISDMAKKVTEYSDVSVYNAYVSEKLPGSISKVIAARTQNNILEM